MAIKIGSLHRQPSNQYLLVLQEKTTEQMSNLIKCARCLVSDIFMCTGQLLTAQAAALFSSSSLESLCKPQTNALIRFENFSYTK